MNPDEQLEALLSNWYESADMMNADQSITDAFWIGWNACIDAALEQIDLAPHVNSDIQTMSGARIRVERLRRTRAT